MSAIPHAIAPAGAVAISAGSVSAKRSEVKEPEVKEPDLNTSDLKVLLYSPQHHVVQVGNASSVAPSPVVSPDVMMPEIDLNADVLCVCSDCCGGHAHLADVLAQPTCECLGLLALCFQHVGNDRALGWLATCDTCSAVLPAADLWRIVQVLR